MSTTLALIPNWLGDVVMSLPALHELRRRGPLLAAGAPALLQLLSDTGAVDLVEPFDRRGADRGIAGLWRTGARLRAHRPELAVVFAPSLRAAALARAAGARRSRGLVGQARALLLNERRRAARPRGARHLADEWLALARDDGAVTAGEAVPVLRPGALGGEGLQRLRQQTPGLPPPGAFVALAPGATYGPTKRWSAAGFGQLGRLLQLRQGLACVVVGGPDPHERDLCSAVAHAAGGVSVAGRTDLATLAALLAEAAAFVGNDSGPMHLAAATGIPTVGIFGSTTPRWTGPRGRAAAACGPHPVPCTPCFRPTCPIGLPCLEGITPEDVAAALDSLRAGATAPARSPAP